VYIDRHFLEATAGGIRKFEIGILLKRNIKQAPAEAKMLANPIIDAERFLLNLPGWQLNIIYNKKFNGPSLKGQ
jgi:hypothetical protein